MEAPPGFDVNSGYRNQFEAFRGMFERLLKENETLKAQYDHVLGEYENEQAGRQMWFKRAKQYESEATSLKRANEASPMVYVMLDGDGAIFRDELLAKSEGSGGAEAAHLLNGEITKYLQELYPESNVDDWNIILQVVLNIDGCAKTLHRAGVTTNTHSQFQTFLQRFCGARPLFSVVDVGYGKEEADHKVREMLRVMSKVHQCKHIIFGPSHDTGYVPVIRPYAGDPALMARMTLLQTRPAHPQIAQLGFKQVNFPSVFRDTDLATIRAVPASTTSRFTAEANGTSLPILTPSRSTDSTSPTPGTASAGSSWATLSKPVGSTKEFSLVSNKKTAASSAPKFYFVNAQDERLDAELPRTNALAEKHFAETVEREGRNYCNEYHLLGSCDSGDFCRYIHGARLTGPELLVLRHKARSLICKNAPSCTDPDCYMGHHCRYGGKKCTYPNCRFAALHYVDTTPNAKVFEDGTRQRL